MTQRRFTILGFTLVELIIVVTIISVLASLAFMALSGETAQARDAKRMNDIKIFENAIATSNGKNKKIRYTLDFETISRNPQTASYLTNAGSFQALRGGYLIPLMPGIFDSDIIANMPTDPKGAYYLGVFLSETDYQLFATKENSETKIPTAYVKGSFREDAVIGVLLNDVSMSSSYISFPDPTRFVAGDIIKIDSEYMVVTGINATTQRVMVYRDARLPLGVNNSNGITVHSKVTPVRLYRSAPNANSLLCKGTLSSASVANTINTFASDGGGAFIDDAISPKTFVSETILSNDWGNVCNGNVVIDGEEVIPYLASN